MKTNKEKTASTPKGGRGSKATDYTPTPWAWDDNGMLRSVETGDTIRIEATYKSTDVGPANAKFIVRAVNRIEKTEELLKKAYEFLADGSLLKKEIKEFLNG